MSAGNPSFAFLQEILRNFAGIPYENISKIIKLNQYWHTRSECRRFPEEVIRNHISCKLGGTCFSMTYFLQSILKECNFTSYPVMADMRAGNNIHCCLVVVLHSVRYLVDPGYLLSQPVPLSRDTVKRSHNEFSGIEVRYHAALDCYNLWTFDENASKWRYRFKDTPVKEQAFTEHWLASFERNSMHGICLTKVTRHGMVYIHKNFMRETTYTAKVNHNIRRNYHRAINENFGISEHIVEQARAALIENMRTKQESLVIAS